MRYLSKPKFEREMNKLKAQNEQLRMRNELLAERNKYRKKPKMEMSKKFAIYIFILLNVVVGYSLIAMWHFQDLSYLGTLITAVVAECFTFITYCVKAYKAKNSEETLKYLFDPYYQGDSSHSQQGLGLGLSIAKRIVEMIER